MISNSVITLTTDFGVVDPYVGAMKGAILRINPTVNVLDITHQILPQNVFQASFLLGHSYTSFSALAIHVVVIDPGVGSFRRPLLLDTPYGRFVAPDNGVLSHVLFQGMSAYPEDGGQSLIPEGWRAFHLTNENYWLHPVSPTFHGRDVFGPVAAHLSLGVPSNCLGKRIYEAVCLPISEPKWQEGIIDGKVAHIDRFGNMITDIPRHLLDCITKVEVKVKGHTIKGIDGFYAEGDGLMALIGSYDTLEIAVKNGNAAARLGGHMGDSLLVVNKA
ncbi:SAM-dependent chlorinase/fluorinase [SAR202 cluster bacterium AD-804-J14_MRT_500m]|nr:SAM-dependent chlorinase/fluorinase [SAR202 cluster bacterium AD-804-J14_MRT_500m]